MSMSIEECRLGTSAEIECQVCGDIVCMEDFGKGSGCLGGQCETCGADYLGNSLAGYEICNDEKEQKINFGKKVGG